MLLCNEDAIGTKQTSAASGPMSPFERKTDLVIL